MSSFEKTSTKDFKRFREIKEKNDYFTDNYIRAKNLDKNLFRTGRRVEEDPLDYLKDRYRTKNFDIDRMINLDKDPLFQTSTLLLEENEVMNHFRIQSKTNNQIIKNDVKYLNKLKTGLLTKKEKNSRKTTLQPEEDNLEEIKNQYKALRKQNNDLKLIISNSEESELTAIKSEKHVNKKRSQLSIFSQRNLDTLPQESTLASQVETVHFPKPKVRQIKVKSNKQLRTSTSQKIKMRSSFRKQGSLRFKLAKKVEAKFIRDKKTFNKVDCKSIFSSDELKLINKLETLLYRGDTEKSKTMYVERLYKIVKEANIEDNNSLLHLVRFYNLFEKFNGSYFSKINHKGSATLQLFNEFFMIKNKIKELPIEEMLKNMLYKTGMVVPPEVLKKIRKINSKMRRTEKDLMRYINAASVDK